jgi:hypothetical protein
MSNKGGRDLQSRYEFNSTLAERIALLIIVGLAVEIASVFIVGKPLLWEGVLTIFANVLIAAGVWGELRYSKRAKEAGDGIVAEANARASEAQLQLERLRAKLGPRKIDPDIFLKALDGRPKSPIEIMFPKEDGEAFMLAIQFRDLLRTAKWEASEPVPVPPTDIPRLDNQPSHMAAGAQATGVAVVVRADTNEEFDRVTDFKANTSMNALRDALARTLGGVAGYAGGADIFTAPSPGTVRIVVGPKP